MGEIAVIVLNWNRKNDTLRCLESLRHVVSPQIQVMVVDNASTDGSAEAIESAFPDIWMIRNQANLGFAEGNNVAIRQAIKDGFPYVMLLNNDTVVAPDAIHLMFDALTADDHIGVSAPAICFLADPDRIWSAGGRIAWSQGAVHSDYYNATVDVMPGSIYEVDHVSGCAMLLRSAAIVDAGLLDNRFFMYYEESEWCARIARSGYRIVVQPQARVYHDIDPNSQLGSPAIAYYMTRNHLLFLRATRAPLRAWVYTVAWQIRTLGALFLKPSSPERARGRIPMLRAMRDFAIGRFGALPESR